MRTITKEFATTAEEMTFDPSMVDPNVGMEEPQTTGMPMWGWAVIAVCGVVIVVVIVVVIKRRKKKKALALAALEAEDSDEDL